MDGAIALPLPYVALVIVCVLISFTLAWIGGHLARGAWTHPQSLTNRGYLMVISLWFSAATLTWAYLVMALVLLSPAWPETTLWALRSVPLSPLVPVGLIVGDLVFGATASMLSSGAREVIGGAWARRQTATTDSTPVYYGDGSSGDGDGGKIVFLLILAMIAVSLAVLTVWLVAWAGARRGGARLSLFSAYTGRQTEPFTMSRANPEPMDQS